MATKEFVGPVDCYAALLPDEEYFLLMARDPLAAGLTMIWASLRLGDARAAMDNFTRLAAPELIRHYMNHPDQAKAEEAVEVAQRMVTWRERNLRGWDGKPTWKSRRAVGVERFITEYVERTKDGAAIVRVTDDELPFWVPDVVRQEYKPHPKLVEIMQGGATDGRPAVPPAELADDCS